MARYDKYDPISGGERGVLKSALSKNSAGNGIGVGLDASGLVVPGAGQTGIIGVLIVTRNFAAGDTVDVMRHGEIVDCVSPLAAGKVITADTTSGALGVSAVGATKTAVGHTSEATRLIVNVSNPAVLSGAVTGAQTGIVDLVLTSPTDTPATADALRDDLNTNVLPPIVAKINAIIATLEAAGITAVV